MTGNNTVPAKIRQARPGKKRARLERSTNAKTLPRERERGEALSCSVRNAHTHSPCPRALAPPISPATPHLHMLPSPAGTATCHTALTACCFTTPAKLSSRRHAVLNSFARAQSGLAVDGTCALCLVATRCPVTHVVAHSPVRQVRRGSAAERRPPPRGHAPCRVVQS